MSKLDGGINKKPIEPEEDLRSEVISGVRKILNGSFHLFDEQKRLLEYVRGRVMRGEATKEDVEILRILLPNDLISSMGNLLKNTDLKDKLRETGKNAVLEQIVEMMRQEP